MRHIVVVVCVWGMGLGWVQAQETASGSQAAVAITPIRIAIEGFALHLKDQGPRWHLQGAYRGPPGVALEGIELGVAMPSGVGLYRDHYLYRVFHSLSRVHPRLGWWRFWVDFPRGAGGKAFAVEMPLQRFGVEPNLAAVVRILNYRLDTISLDILHHWVGFADSAFEEALLNWIGWGKEQGTAQCGLLRSEKPRQNQWAKRIDGWLRQSDVGPLRPQAFKARLVAFVVLAQLERERATRLVTDWIKQEELVHYQSAYELLRARSLGHPEGRMPLAHRLRENRPAAQAGGGLQGLLMGWVSPQ